MKSKADFLGIGFKKYFSSFAHQQVNNSKPWEWSRFLQIFTAIPVVLPGPTKEKAGEWRQNFPSCNFFLAFCVLLYGARR